MAGRLCSCSLPPAVPRWLQFDDPGCGCEEPGPRSIDATTQGLQGRE